MTEVPAVGLPERLARSRLVLPLVLVVHSVLGLYTAVVTLRTFPVASDEYCYLVQAELLASGRLSVPSPQDAEFFGFENMVNNGRYFGKYPPGWPLLLSIGVLIGAPWIVNVLIGGLTLAVLHLTVRKHFSLSAANLTLVLLIGCPFFVFNSASHFSHPSCLLALSLACHFYFNGLENPGAIRPAALFGASAGFAFLIRPFTAAAMTVPLWIHWAIRTWTMRRSPGVLRASAAALGAALGFLVLFLLYNYLQTGNPFLQPFSLYDAQDRPRIPLTGGVLGDWLVQFVVLRLWELTGEWMPLCLPLAVAALAVRSLREDPKIRLLLCAVGSLILSFSLYPTDGGTRYGPRYIYEALGAIAILSGCALNVFPRWSLPIAAAVVLLNVVGFAGQSRQFSESTRRKMEPYDLAEERKLSRAIVFLKTGSGEAPPEHLTRNGIGFNRPVLFVRDLGAKNWTLVDHLDRDGYVFEVPPAGGKGRIVPLRR